MKKWNGVWAPLAIALMATGALSQQSSPTPSGEKATAPASDASLIRGCLDSERGNYIVIENGTSMVYALKSVDNKLEQDLHHEVEVKGKVLPGAVNTGVRPEKAAETRAIHYAPSVPSRFRLQMSRKMCA